MDVLFSLAVVWLSITLVIRLRRYATLFNYGLSGYLQKQLARVLDAARKYTENYSQVTIAVHIIAVASLLLDINLVYQLIKVLSILSLV